MSNITCHACGKPRRMKMLSFTENNVPYCVSYWLCNDKHPSNPSNPNKIPLFSSLEVKGINDQVYLLMTKPFSMRIGDYTTCKFLTDLQAEKGFANMSDTVRYCLESFMKTHEPEPTPEPAPVPQPQKEEEWTF